MTLVPFHLKKRTKRLFVFQEADVLEILIAKFILVSFLDFEIWEK